ncbi:hypothetical protein N7537_010846 [Penicillium hordei]|uniref:Uncharacterized protein n=1 Tax=Penicillium hordei TaxID=40994 RepID=A0AAD6DKM7_9EURO|nr:uncharacterized protein N7537_010846 [Penicillium hordei]KAJ5588168.1 hypothetical protein N7537_010846 [Penicillium hordei]
MGLLSIPRLGLLATIFEKGFHLRPLGLWDIAAIHSDKVAPFVIVVFVENSLAGVVFFREVCRHVRAIGVVDWLANELNVTSWGSLAISRLIATGPSHQSIAFLQMLFALGVLLHSFSQLEHFLAAQVFRSLSVQLLSQYEPGE